MKDWTKSVWPSALVLALAVTAIGAVYGVNILKQRAGEDGFREAVNAFLSDRTVMPGPQDEIDEFLNAPLVDLGATGASIKAKRGATMGIEMIWIELEIASSQEFDDLILRLTDSKDESGRARVRVQRDLKEPLSVSSESPSWWPRDRGMGRVVNLTGKRYSSRAASFTLIYDYTDDRAFYFRFSG